MNKLLNPIAAAAYTFINILAPDGIVTLQTFDNDKVRKNMGMARVMHGTLTQFWDELVLLNQCGAGIFIMINQGDGIIHPGDKTCRTAKNVVAVRSATVRA